MEIENKTRFYFTRIVLSLLISIFFVFVAEDLLFSVCLFSQFFVLFYGLIFQQSRKICISIPVLANFKEKNPSRPSSNLISLFALGTTRDNPKQMLQECLIQSKYNCHSYIHSYGIKRSKISVQQNHQRNQDKTPLVAPINSPSINQNPQIIKNAEPNEHPQQQSSQQKKRITKMKSARKPEPIKIPNDLCQKIMNCEYEIDSGSFNEQMVIKTTELYSVCCVFMQEAVNFFLVHSDYNQDNLKKAHFYQDKIKRLLGREDVRMILEGERVNPRVSDLQKQMEKAKQSAPHQAKRLLEFYKNQSNTQSVLIKKTVEQQNQKLQQRLSIRSKSKSKLALSSPKLSMVERKLKTPQ